MSSPHVLYDSNGDEFHLAQNYVRYGNRIIDASFIATITVKKHKLLFNNFKQNTMYPVLSVPFKKETDARHAMNKCLEFYDLSHSNPFYSESDRRNEVHLVDAYGGVMHVTPDFLKYRDRVLNTSDVRTLHLKGRRVLVNHFKGNTCVPTMCVHFAEKTLAVDALNTIQGILWNLPVSQEDVIEVEEEDDSEVLCDENSTLSILHGSPDPVFLTFLTVGTSILLILSVLRVLLIPGYVHDEL